ncbi:hypothetical protein PMAYCL1PPCAC_15954, partial [Pristionchus mayeri]
MLKRQHHSRPVFQESPALSLLPSLLIFFADFPPHFTGMSAPHPSGPNSPQMHCMKADEMFKQTKRTRRSSDER